MVTTHLVFFFFGGAGGVVPPPSDEVVSGGGGIERIFKPTGLVDRKKTKDTRVEKRVEESREIHAEVVGKLARELADLPEIKVPEVSIALSDVDREIGMLLRKVQRTQEEEILLLMLMAVA